jgi:hypothetical protein
MLPVVGAAAQYAYDDLQRADQNNGAVWWLFEHFLGDVNDGTAERRMDLSHQ